MADPGFATRAGGWPVILGTLMEGGDLDADTARVTMAEILEGAASPAQIAAFIVALRMKGETVAELGGMVDAMLDASTRVDIDTSGPVIDVVGTGGDRAHTINVSTLSAVGGRRCRWPRLQARQPGGVVGLRRRRPPRGPGRRDRAGSDRRGGVRRRGRHRVLLRAARTTRRCATPVRPAATWASPRRSTSSARSRTPAG